MMQGISFGSCWRRRLAKRMHCSRRSVSIILRPWLQATAYVGQFLEQMLSNGFVYETEAAES